MCASKACHFLLPKVFIVTDNKGTGIFDYEFVWRGLKDEWSRFTHQEQAKRDLKKWINSESLHPCYPWETNIMELCLIGYKHGREQRKQINAK